MIRAIVKSYYFKLIAISLAITVLAICAINATLAYFNDSKETNGSFTAGNVYISLTEANVIRDARGNLVEDTSLERLEGSEIGTQTVHDYGMLFPGEKIHKDPTIKNTGDYDAWVAAKIIITDGVGDIHNLFKFNNSYDDIDIEGFISGGLLAEDVEVGDWNGNQYVCFNEKYAMVQIANRDAGVYEFYFFMLNTMAPGESVELFDTFYVDHEFGNVEMREFKDFKITVQAFAVQKQGFLSCLEAMTTAFSSNFLNVVNE